MKLEFQTQARPFTTFRTQANGQETEEYRLTPLTDSKSDYDSYIFRRGDTVIMVVPKKVVVSVELIEESCRTEEQTS